MLTTWQVVNYSLIIKYLLHTTDNAISDFIKVQRFTTRKHLLTRKMSPYYLNIMIMIISIKAINSNALLQYRNIKVLYKLSIL